MNEAATTAIRVEQTRQSKLPQVDFNNLKFGQTFSDHMLVADYVDGHWTDVSIVPYGNLSLSPATSALHYGQAIFEGMKAYRFANGTVSLFRPHKNLERFNKSALRLEMPEVPEDIFIGGLKTLIDLDRDWVPGAEGSSLYIRPFMFGTEPALGVHPSDSYKFIVITSPVGAYYHKSLRLKVETHFTRAAEGGVGFSKNAGNYALSLHPTRLAQQEGFDQLIWTDANEHKYVEEAGTANLLFRVGDTIITPSSDTILHGITRRTIIEIARHWGYQAEERKVSVKELIDGIEDGSVTEAFAAGTAATLTPITEIGYEGRIYTLPDPAKRVFSNKVLQYLNDLRYGRIDDEFGWNLIVD
ncbi:branched-chain amino acid aminotransferase [Parapedobacter sp. ISTM3]|uniref:branched-chain-amino-acid transaminase n=1 Tax=Parapedobacter luteus TaxID=623280 RepID=A0A1T5BVF6_9SPHI|nr:MULTISPECIES: branched-chain amino acid aminotransferase [Parapedobacter]MBK1442345.1 branched-chain amino acid aminotransferase [Parapedobacter sp. ISTM3]SKB51185.1 branched-chain amino acid aminotransferase [Parapedobacter luteus]